MNGGICHYFNIRPTSFLCYVEMMTVLAVSLAKLLNVGAKEVAIIIIIIIVILKNRSISTQNRYAQLSMLVQRNRFVCNHARTSIASIRTIKHQKFLVTRKIIASL